MLRLRVETQDKKALKHLLPITFQAIISLTKIEENA